mgnify:CR=1 FL=1
MALEAPKESTFSWVVALIDTASLSTFKILEIMLHISDTCGFNFGCISNCSEQGSDAAQAGYNQLLQCTLAECVGSFSPTCLVDVMDKECKKEWDACQGGLQ